MMTERKMINAINRTKYSFWKIGEKTGTCYIFTPDGHYCEFDSLADAFEKLA